MNLRPSVRQKMKSGITALIEPTSLWELKPQDKLLKLRRVLEELWTSNEWFSNTLDKSWTSRTSDSTWSWRCDSLQLQITLQTYKADFEFEGKMSSPFSLFPVENLKGERQLPKI